MHSEKIIHLIEAVGLEHVESADSISVTTHPGLGGSLLVGKTAAEMLGRQYSKKVLGVNHVYGHIFSLLLERNVKDLPFPWVVLTASGGHNEIYLVNYEGEISEDTLFLLSEVTIAKLGQTLDDAAGECFDKVARMLGGPYPGGARIGEKATR